MDEGLNDYKNFEPHPKGINLNNHKIVIHQHLRIYHRISSNSFPTYQSSSYYQMTTGSNSEMRKESFRSPLVSVSCRLETGL